MEERNVISEMMKSSDKITYMNMCGEIKINSPYEICHGYKIQLTANEFRIFANKCINLDCESSYGTRLIHLVCYSGTIDMLRCLVTHGVEVNCIGGDWDYPIHGAFYNENTLEMVKCLVENGADIN
jgi:ankyrin repeat protein